MLRKRALVPGPTSVFSTGMREGRGAGFWYQLWTHVLSAFKATGKGWQTRIDAVLREAVEAGRV